MPAAAFSYLPADLTAQLPQLRTTYVVRQMLAADHSYGTRVQEEKLQAADFSAPIRGKIVYMPRRSCDDSCNT
jgi:hypothetical protein